MEERLSDVLRSSTGRHRSGSGTKNITFVAVLVAGSSGSSLCVATAGAGSPADCGGVVRTQRIGPVVEGAAEAASTPALEGGVRLPRGSFLRLRRRQRDRLGGDLRAESYVHAIPLII